MESIWETEEQRKIKEYYTEFSAETRRKLLSRNLVKPASIYDVLNIKTRESLLSKNTPAPAAIIDTYANSVRNALLSKTVKDSQDIQKDSAANRDALLAKNKVLKVTEELLNQSQTARNNVLSKNVADNKNLLKDSAAFLKNNLSNNAASTENLAKDSATYRTNNLANNTPSTEDLLKNSVAFRNNNLSNNAASTENLLKDSTTFLKNNLSNNTTSTEDLSKDSVTFRNNNLSNNAPSTENLAKDSVAFRDNNLSNNAPSTENLATDSTGFLKNNLSNNTSSTEDLSKDSVAFRKNNLSNNAASTEDLSKDSVAFRKNNLSNNNPSTENLAKDSVTFRDNNLSNNAPSTENLAKDSVAFRDNNLSNNAPSTENLAKDSVAFRNNNLSNNAPSTENIAKDSAGFLKNNLSNNTSSTEDLSKDSVTFRNNNLSNNAASTEDLAKDSIAFRNNNLANNTSSTEDLAKDSVPFLNNNLAHNTSSAEDLAKDSVPFLNNNLKNNVPSSEDLLKDSASYLKNNLASNTPSTEDLSKDSIAFRNNNLSNNAPSTEDLSKDSAGFLKNNLSNNTPSTEDLSKDSASYLKNNLSHNTTSPENLLKDSETYLISNLNRNLSSPQDLLTDSVTFLNNNLAANPPVVIPTSESNNFIQGAVFRLAMLAINEFNLALNPYPSGDNGNLILESSVDFFGQPVSLDIIPSFDGMAFYNNTIGQPLRQLYGTSQVNDPSTNIKIGGGFFATDSNDPKGGSFLSIGNAPGVQYTYSRYADSIITDAIRNYNLQRNIFNLAKLTPGDLSSVQTIYANNNDQFQNMLNMTHSFQDPTPVGAIPFDNATPTNIQTQNNNGYLGADPETILNPQNTPDAPAPIGTPQSMMMKTIAGNPLDNKDFMTGKRGVRYIVNTIKNSNVANFSINYDVQNATEFVIGSDVKGAPVFTRQKWSVANPYAGATSKSVVFSLTNYASSQTYFFPPYISNYSDNFDANWNEVQFLGRPEPIYTYNNSTRGGVIDFYVLTDYTQNVVIGTDWSTNALNAVTFGTKKHFTASDTQYNLNNQLQAEQSNAAIQNNKNNKNQIDQFLSQNGVQGASQLQQDSQNSQTQGNSISDTQQSNTTLTSTNPGTQYSVNNPNAFNSMMLMTANQKGRDGSGNIDDQAGNTIDALNQMVQTLQFQPAFFSGDKVDFITKMDFLAKLTRPSVASSGSSFSFTNPPVCHIRLGDWWNHDIIIRSVQFNYDEVPWTLDPGERVQPMWAKVSISFNVVGPWGGVGNQGSIPVLSTDLGGIYSPRGKVITPTVGL